MPFAQVVLHVDHFEILRAIPSIELCRQLSSRIFVSYRILLSTGEGVYQGGRAFVSQSAHIDGLSGRIAMFLLISN